MIIFYYHDIIFLIYIINKGCKIAFIPLTPRFKCALIVIGILVNVNKFVQQR